MLSIDELVSRHAQHGRLEAICVRPERKAPVIEVPHVLVSLSGLEGDHRAKPGPRAVTLLQYEHLDAIASITGLETVTPGMLRRNLVISRINLLTLRDRQFRIGEAVFAGTGICAPCSRMETILGNGGYNAMRGHGGITARVVQEGKISTGDRFVPCSSVD